MTVILRNGQTHLERGILKMNNITTHDIYTLPLDSKEIIKNLIGLKLEKIQRNTVDVSGDDFKFVGRELPPIAECKGDYILTFENNHILHIVDEFEETGFVIKLKEIKTLEEITKRPEPPVTNTLDLSNYFMLRNFIDKTLSYAEVIWRKLSVEEGGIADELDQQPCSQTGIVLNFQETNRELWIFISPIHDCDLIATDNFEFISGEVIFECISDGI